jgi:hypothetical protein
MTAGLRLRRLLAGDEEVAEDQRIHLGAQETVDGFFRAADDGFVVVEGGVEHHRDAGEIFKPFDQLPVTRIGFARDSLQAAGTVHMSGRGNFVAFFGAHGLGKGHER